jgi:hypothetical protein
MSGVGFGYVMAAVFLREIVNETVLNPWKIYEQTKEKMKPLASADKPKKKEQPTEKSGEKEVDFTGMTDERVAYLKAKKRFDLLQKEQKESSKRDLVTQNKLKM